eukprot:CAMPEP_0181310942 /NCGR_PEP_ID=MMETSP1101-20121128/12865_1 /TAXON_ID=46948 /ORGANISM="Rhodomonas abbreviata, Strain Caron Lab Isolate" /LENGTH=137 /DNA_ID=CAMNT_0023417625 /DNA_START=282 /DNA_END=695 /DNA_ORIENTATION=+
MVVKRGKPFLKNNVTYVLSSCCLLAVDLGLGLHVLYNSSCCSWKSGDECAGIIVELIILYVMSCCCWKSGGTRVGFILRYIMSSSSRSVEVDQGGGDVDGTKALSPAHPSCDPTPVGTPIYTSVAGMPLQAGAAVYQ